LTYREVEFASFRDFFRKNLEEFQDTRETCWVCPKRVRNCGQDVMPIRHANRQLRQANIELRPYDFLALAELLEENQYLITQLQSCFGRNLTEVVDNLEVNISLTLAMSHVDN
jgi:hypothetical protein